MARGRALIRAANFTAKRRERRGLEPLIPTFTAQEKALHKAKVVAERKANALVQTPIRLASDALKRPPTSHLTQAVGLAYAQTVERHRLWDLLNGFKYDGVGLKIKRDVWDKWEEPCYYTIIMTKRKVP